jgi:hypothetical protein
VISSVSEVVKPSIQTLTPYPNPAENSLQLSGWGSETQFPVIVEIYNTAGIMVHQQILESRLDAISTSALTPGLYLAQTADQNGNPARFRFVTAHCDER